MTDVYLEVGSKKVFASAAQWPGWSRSGRTEDAALEALADYRSRYAEVAERAALKLPPARESLQVVERLPGDITTDFGAPGAIAEEERKPLPTKEAERVVSLVEAAWGVLDRVTATAPAELRKGPRGGGRDRDKMLDHVLGAEQMYARKLGVRHRQPAVGDTAAITALREAIVTALRSGIAEGAATDGGWPARYAARRVAWHVLDHAWEMQDRSQS